MKNLIFIGKARTGKSLFALMIFGREKTFYIDGRCDLNDRFLFDDNSEKWEYENVIIDDLRSSLKFGNPDFHQRFIYNQILLHRRGKLSEAVKRPRFIFIVDSEEMEINIPGLFQDRFSIIDFDKNTIADLTKILTEEKIIIKTDY